MWNGTAMLATALSGIGLTWLVQSTALLALGLLAGRLLKRAGAAVQSGIYRTTLAAVLVCPCRVGDPDRGGLRRLGLSAADPDDRRGPRTRPPDDCPAHLRAAATATSDRDTVPEVWEQPEPSPRLANISRNAPESSAPSATVQPGSTSLSAIVMVPAVGLSIWLFGAAVLGARLVVGHLRMTRLRATAVPADPGARCALPRPGGPDGCGDAERLAESVSVQPLSRRTSKTGDPAAGRRWVKTCARRLFMNSRTSPGATACGTSSGGRVWRRFGSNRSSGPFRGGWRVPPKRSVTTMSSSSGPIGRATRANFWHSPNAPCRRCRRQASAWSRCARCSRGGSFDCSTRRGRSRRGPARGQCLPCSSLASPGRCSRACSVSAAVRARRGHRRRTRNRHRKTRPSTVRSSVQRVSPSRRENHRLPPPRQPAVGAIRTRVQRGRHDALRIRQNDRGRRRPLCGDVRHSGIGRDSHGPHERALGHRDGPRLWSGLLPQRQADSAFRR